MKKGINLAVSFFVFFFFFIFLTSFYVKVAHASVLGEWSSTESLSSELASHASLGVGNRLFIFGGATSDDSSTVWSSGQVLEGNLSEWEIVSNLPDTRFWGSIVAHNDVVYFLGGTRFPGSENSTVFSSQIDQDGIFSDWEEASNLPQPRSLGSSVTVNQRIYYAGGFSPSGRQSTIFYAEVSPEGVLGEWSISDVNLPEALYGFSMVEDDGYIYVLGGNNASNVSQNKVYSSKVNEDGSISTWVELNSLPLTNYRGHALVHNNRIILIGGEHGSGIFLDKIYYADILNGGLISEWQEDEYALPIPVSSGSLSRMGEYIYLTGGLTTGFNYLDTAFFSKLNNSKKLNVITFKQTSEPWNDDVYNTAQNWASDPSFSRWGCAVTSAAMVFKYHGLDLIENEVDLDPGSINEWLKSQPDGYVRNGLVNWLALTRLSREISDLNESNFSALEFEKIFSTDHQLVKNAIDDEQNPRPDILRVPGHFVVGKGYDDETILINDPFEDTDKLAFYSNNFENISRFTPSNTDLSYIMLTIDEAFDIKVFDESNNEVGVLFLEDSITDPLGEVEPTAPSIKTYYFRKPPSGTYRVEVNGPQGQEYGFEVFLYDEMGNVSTFLFEEEFEETHIYDIAFNKQDSAESNIVKAVEVTYDSLLKDLNELYREKEIKFGGLVSLTAQLKAAQFLQWNNKVEKKLLNNFKKSLPKLKKAKQITSFAEEELKIKIDILIENI